MSNGQIDGIPKDALNLEKLYCDRPNYASLFYQRIKNDFKMASFFPSKGNRHNKRDCVNTKVRNPINYKYKYLDSSEDKMDINDPSTKIKITKQEPNSDDAFDTHVSMLRGNDDLIMMADQSTDTVMMDPCWSQASSPASTYDWKVEPSHDQMNGV